MTERLSPADAGFLYTEDATTPMHVGGVAILAPTQPFDYARIVELIDARLALVPRYRQKVRFVPGRFARPVWVDDEDFDLTYHVRRSALPKPGTDAQLADLVGRLISRPLDRSRPLWELYVVEGLSGGRVALVNKTHHAMVDRMGAVDIAAAILDISPEPRPLPRRAWLPTPAPSDIDLVIDAVVDISTRPAEVVDAVRLAALDVRATVDEVGRTLTGMWQIARQAVRPAPRSMLNVPVSGSRRFAGVSLDLARLKAVRDTHGGTVNDIILTVIAGALRSFLVSRGEPVLPGTTLRALVPVSVRTPTGEADVPVESYLIDLPVSEPNPVIRLHQVSFAMSGHTESGQSVAADSLMELGRFAPSTLHILGARVGSQLGRRLYNLLITNVPGPQIPLYAAGIPVTAMYPVATLIPGQALAVSVTSYHGQVFFGLTADRDAMPDLDDFGPLLQESVDEFPATTTRRATRPETVPPTPVGPRPVPADRVAARPVPTAAGSTEQAPTAPVPKPRAPRKSAAEPGVAVPRRRVPRTATVEPGAPAPQSREPRKATAERDVSAPKPRAPRNSAAEPGVAVPRRREPRTPTVEPGGPAPQPRQPRKSAAARKATAERAAPAPQPRAPQTPTRASGAAAARPSTPLSAADRSVAPDRRAAPNPRPTRRARPAPKPAPPRPGRSAPSSDAPAPSNPPRPEPEIAE